MGSYTRRVRLADAVDADKIEASYNDGVLTVRVPVEEKAKPRKVEIRPTPRPSPPDAEVRCPGPSR